MANETFTEESAEVQQERMLESLPSWSQQAASYFLGLAGAKYGLEASQTEVERVGRVIAGHLPQDTYPTPVDVPAEFVHSLLNLAALPEEVSLG